LERKLLLGEVFEDGKPQVIMTSRVPDTLYKLINEDAGKQKISISILVRDLLAVHYLAKHLKTELEKNSSLAAGEVTLMEGFRSYVSELVRSLKEIDVMRGQKKTVDPDLQGLIERMVNDQLASRMTEFEEVWQRIIDRKK
jgi:hypothetical protein